MVRLTLVLAFACLAFWSASGRAEDRWDGRRIEKLAEQLRDEEYVRREDASRRLAEAPASVLPIVERLAQETDDPEAGLRLQAAAREIFRNRVVQLLPEWKKGRGFLGIRWTITPGEAGVVVNEVLADTAADRSGLRTGDVILSANGKPFHEGMTHEDAMLIWRQMLPGDRMKLVLKKADSDEPTEMDVVVGSMPAEYQAEQSEGEKVDKLWSRYREGRLQIPQGQAIQSRDLQSWPAVLQTPSK